MKLTSCSLSATSSRAWTSSQTVHVRNKTFRTNRKQKEEHRQKLRNAIDLYHLSSAFYPTEATTTGKASKTTLLDHRIVQDVLGRVMLKEHASQSQNLHFSTPATLVLQAQRLSQESRSLGAAGSGATFTVDRPDLADDLLSSGIFASTSQPANVAYDPYATGELSDARVDASTLRHVRDLAKQLAAQRTTGTPARGTHEATRFDVASLNEREGRVRDALFGTVRGTLPGLETLRARILKRQKEQREANARAEGQEV